MRRSPSVRSSTLGCARRPGFTLIEVLIVLVIGAIVAGYAAPRVSQAFATRAVVDGRDAIIWFSARARATALQTGTVTSLEIDPALDYILIRLQDADSTLVDSRDLAEENKVDISTGSGTTIVVCYSPRGWAVTGGCTSGVPGTVTIVRDAQTSSVEVQALGQVERVS